jgi:GMP synthase (glutamine-hydrolysing)
MTPKILLLQARHTNDTARLDERRSFAQRAGIDEEYIVPHDLLTSVPSVNQVMTYDALMVGGSGEYYVSKANLPEFPAVLELLAEIVDVGHPTFASCFGFQLMVKALGGEIVYDPENMEVGTYSLSLTEAGQKDELFDYLPPVFQAQLGHKDRAGRLPDGVLNLAASQHAPYQALRVPGKPIWATQFHPELTGAENLKRFRQYLDGYAAMLGPEELQATLDRFGDSPETDLLIARFLKIVFG